MLRLGVLALGHAARFLLDALHGLLRPRARDRLLAARLEGSARRLARVLGELKGPFAKAGQFAQMRVDLLPATALAELAGLRDRVPPLPFEVLRPMIEAELGAPVDSLFANIDPQPMGAASIAQAHRAELADGRIVVVKLQYPWLEASLPADLAVSKALLGLWNWGRRKKRRVIDPDLLFAEFAAGLAEELDFEREAAIAGEIAANLAGDDQIVVPEVIPDLSSRRVLTVVHHPAIPILDREALEARGIDAAQVLEVLARAYAKQVFVDGLFHADPHPGNLFVVDEPGAAERPRVLFVDFGLSRRLDPKLAAQMRVGIFALLQGKPDDFLAAMDRMGMIRPGAAENVRRSLETMFGRVEGERAAPLDTSVQRVLALKDEAKALLEETEGLQLPGDLLLYAKTLSYLFQLGEQLAPNVDLVRISMPYALRFLATKN